MMYMQAAVSAAKVKQIMLLQARFFLMAGMFTLIPVLLQA